MTPKACCVLVAVLMLGTGIDATEAWAQGKVKNISQCTEITEPGSYLLKKGLHQAAPGNSDCLVIQVDFVTIDLNGLTIAGNGVGSGISDRGTHLRGVTIRNGTVTNGVRGIDLAATSGAPPSPACEPSGIPPSASTWAATVWSPTTWRLTT